MPDTLGFLICQGRCVPEASAAIVAPIYILHFIPAILTGILAWKTSGVDDLYSESKWVLAFILVQFQVSWSQSVVLYIVFET
jgi:hypothetical protein